MKTDRIIFPVARAILEFHALLRMAFYDSLDHML